MQAFYVCYAPIATDLRERSEVEHLGETFYADNVREYVEPDRNGEFIALDINSGDYCVDSDELSPLRGLRLRQPNARIYFARVGASIVYELRGLMFWAKNDSCRVIPYEFR